MKTTEEKIEIMRAYLDGKKIQYYSPILEKWGDIKEPAWDWGSTDYRIKPEPCLECAKKVLPDYERKIKGGPNTCEYCRHMEEVDGHKLCWLPFHQRGGTVRTVSVIPDAPYVCDYFEES